MDIKILESVDTKNPRNAYMLTVELMHGDADAYSKITFGPFAKDDEFEVADLEETLRAVVALEKAHDDTGLFDPENFSEVPGFKAKLEKVWPNDTTCDDYLASPNGHYVRYFNATGQEFRTEVTL